LDAIDFTKRDWVPRSGWPFDRAHLKPFYCRAQSLCGLGPCEYGAEFWMSENDRTLPLTGEWCTTKVYQFGPARVFTEVCLHELQRADNVTIGYYMNAIALDTDKDGERVLAVRCASTSGAQFRVRAKTFVLAAGGIENARLLLLSDEDAPGGLGNRYGWVGRCFMEHPRDYSLTWRPRDRELFEETQFYDAHAALGKTVMGRLALREEVMRAEKLTNVSATIRPIASSAALAAKLHLPLRKRWLNRSQPQCGSGWSKIIDKQRSFGGFRLSLHLEQIPEPENRIELSWDRDALGVPKVKVYWRWTERDAANLQRIRELIGSELANSELGTIQIGRAVVPNPLAHHHAGTTRMHENPREGVTDGNGRVHGVENLYVAGSSLFPTAGFANPTLTIVALSLRLADHLKACRFGSALADEPPMETALQDVSYVELEPEKAISSKSLAALKWSGSVPALNEPMGKNKAVPPGQAQLS
jgi:choline dehydrogenase-like flavoprotein